ENFDKLLNYVHDNQRQLLIICQDMEPAILDMLVQNKVKANFKVCVCRAPGFGEEQKDLVEDIGAILGITPFIENEGLEFDKLQDEEILQYLGVSKGVTI